MKGIGAVAFTYNPEVPVKNVMYFDTLSVKKMKYKQNAVTYLAPGKNESLPTALNKKFYGKNKSLPTTLNKKFYDLSTSSKKFGRTDGFTVVKNFTFGAQPMSICSIKSVREAKAGMKINGAVAFTYYPELTYQNVTYFCNIDSKKMQYKPTAITYLAQEKKGASVADRTASRKKSLLQAIFTAPRKKTNPKAFFEIPAKAKVEAESKFNVLSAKTAVNLKIKARKKTTVPSLQYKAVLAPHYVPPLPIIKKEITVLPFNFDVPYAKKSDCQKFLEHCFPCAKFSGW